ncbi:MAG: ice-binding family protein, partial [Nanoarchaeota archaeon]
SPIDSTAITGFALSVDSSDTFSTSSLVTGKIHASDYTSPTPSILTTAVSDMETAYTDAAGRSSPDATELGAGNIGGMTLAPGLYKWGTGVTIPTDLTLSGDGVYIFQVGEDLDLSAGKHIILAGGAQAKNIFWQVAGQATLATTSVFNGNILSQTAIILNTGAVLNGRALAQTAVTLDANIVKTPGTASTSSSSSSSSSSNSGSSGSNTNSGSSSSSSSGSSNTNVESNIDADENILETTVITHTTANTNQVITLKECTPWSDCKAALNSRSCLENGITTLEKQSCEENKTSIPAKVTIWTRISTWFKGLFS